MSIIAESWMFLKGLIKPSQLYVNFQIIAMENFSCSHRRCSERRGVLRNFAKFTGKHLCQSLFFNKVACRRGCFCTFFNLLLLQTLIIECFQPQHIIILDISLSWYLLVQSQEWKHQNNVRNMLKVNNKTPEGRRFFGIF